MPERRPVDPATPTGTGDACAAAPLASVVIPSYNGAAFLEAAIRSVFLQTYRPLELVIVDDGSTDDSLRVIDRVCADAPIDVSRVAQTNQGAPAALERGLSLARGEILAILNCDDLYDARRLERLVPLLGARHGLAISDLHLVDADGLPLDSGHHWPRWYRGACAEVESFPTAGYRLLVHNTSVTSSNFVFTRALWQQVGAFSRHRFVHDWCFVMRAVFFTEPVVVGERLLSYRIHATNTTESVRHLMREEATDALNQYAGLCRGATPPNVLAPCAVHWPRYFPAFRDRVRPFFAPDSTYAAQFDPW